MKNRIIRMFTVICAAVFMACAVSVWAFAEDIPATSTDLTAAEEQGDPETQGEESQPGEPEKPETAEPEKKPEADKEPEGTEPAEDEDSVEIIITATLKAGGSWEGRVSRKKPAALKLDLTRAQTINLLIEGKNAWATVEKADRLTDNPKKTETDDETGLAVITLNAEAGSYLITLGPAAPSPMTAVKVTIMDNQAYEAWKAAQVTEPEEEPEAEPKQEPGEEPEDEPEQEPGEESEAEPEQEPGEEPEDEPEQEPGEEPEGEPEQEPGEEPEGEPEQEPGEEPEGEPAEEETDETAEELPPERDARIALSWDDEEPAYGSVAHFQAVLTGYEDVDYSIQWQWSADREVWNDVEGGTDDHLDVVFSQENGAYRWRIVIYVTLPPEE